MYQIIIDRKGEICFTAWAHDKNLLEDFREKLMDGYESIPIPDGGLDFVLDKASPKTGVDITWPAEVDATHRENLVKTLGGDKFLADRHIVHVGGWSILPETLKGYLAEILMVPRDAPLSSFQKPLPYYLQEVDLSFFMLNVKAAIHGE